MKIGLIQEYEKAYNLQLIAQRLRIVTAQKYHDYIRLKSRHIHSKFVRTKLVQA